MPLRLTRAGFGFSACFGLAARDVVAFAFGAALVVTTAASFSFDVNFFCSGAVSCFFASGRTALPCAFVVSTILMWENARTYGFAIPLDPAR